MVLKLRRKIRFTICIFILRNIPVKTLNSIWKLENPQSDFFSSYLLDTSTMKEITFFKMQNGYA